MTGQGMHGRHRHLRRLFGILAAMLLTGTFVFAAFASALPQAQEEAGTALEAESNTQEPGFSAEYQPAEESGLMEESETREEPKPGTGSEFSSEQELLRKAEEQEESNHSAESEAQTESGAAEGPMLETESGAAEGPTLETESGIAEKSTLETEPTSETDPKPAEEPCHSAESDAQTETKPRTEPEAHEESESEREPDGGSEPDDGIPKEESVQALELLPDEGISIAGAEIQDTVNNGSNGEKPAVRDGRLTLKILDADGNPVLAEELNRAGYQIVWTKQKEGTGSTETVTRKKITQDSYNMDEYGAWINAALDQGARCTYTAVITDPDGNQVGSASAMIQWYDSLQNGSFEIPACVDYGSFQPFVDQNVPGIVWKTTASDGQIEIVSASEIMHDSSGKTNRYMSDLWHGISSAADGEQYAELNANVQSSLYQDVLTIPGSKMYWQAAHAARLRNGGNRFRGTDEMYVVVMNADQASELAKDQKKLVETAKKLAQKDRTVMAQYPGASSTLCTNNSSVWKYNAGTYTVPSGQYVTRYFFVAASSAANQTGYVADENAGSVPSGKAAYNSMGNHIDKVWFSTELPPPSPGNGTLVITKRIYGLDLETVQNELSEKPFLIIDKNSTLTFHKEAWSEELDENNQPCVTASAVMEGILVPSGGVVSRQIQEDTAAAEIPSYQLTCENPDQTVTIADGTICQAVIVNRYQKNKINITIRKQVDGELGDRKKLFSFQCSWMENGTEQTRGFSLKHGEHTEFSVPDGAALILRELNAEGYWIDADSSSGSAPVVRNGTIQFTGEAEMILTVINTKNWVPDTGVTLDSLPYFLILLTAVAGTAALLILRRKDKKEE